MQTRFRITGALAALGVTGLLATPVAYGQICQPTVTDFEKTVALVDRDANGIPTPGDDLDYTIILCNPGATPCGSAITDILDNFLGNSGIDPNDLNVIPLPPKNGCPADGAAICSIGPRGGPFTEVAAPLRCGQDCGSPDDTLVFQPDGSDPSQRIGPGQCYQMRFRAHIASTITSTECLCNQAIAPKDQFGGQFLTHDPNYISLAPGRGCADSETCPTAGTCGTCQKITAEAILSSSIKCIDSAVRPCTATVPKAPGSNVVYNFTIENTGTIDSQPVLFSDPLNFTSSLSTPCLDLTVVPVISAITCSWGPCAAPDYELTWDGAASTVRTVGPFRTIPKGGRLTFSVTARVSAAANGNCTNNWTMTSGLPPVPVQGLNAPVFNANGAVPVIEVTKVPSVDPVAPGATFDWTITIRNTGTVTANGVTFSDAMPGCSTLQSCPTTVPPLGLNCVAPGPVSPTAPFTLAAGASQVVVIRTTASTTPGACVNDISVTGSNFNAVQAQGTVQIQSPTNLTVTKTAGAPSVPSGGTITWTIRVTNNGTTAVNGITLTDAIGANGCETLVACPASNPPITLSCPAGGSVTAGPFDLAAGATQEITVTATAGAAGTCNNRATATSGPTTANGDGSVVITAPAGLSISKVPDSSVVAPGGDIFWTVTVTNNSGNRINNINLTDAIGANGCEDLVSCPSSTPVIPTLSCPAGGTVTSGNFDLAAGDTQVIRIHATAGSTPGTCVNTASTAAPNSASGNGQVTIQVAGACDAVAGDVTDIDPVTPPKTGTWVYTQACVPTGQALPNVVLVNAGPDADLELLSAVPVPLRLYGLDCGCAQVIKLSKQGNPQQVHLNY